MREHATARHYGRLLGLLSGLFALLQVLVSVSSAKANALTIAGLQQAIDNTTAGTPTNPLNLLADLVPVLLITYLAAVIAGAVMMGFAWYAGRLTALTIGRRAFGGVAGFWVALWSGAIWLGLALIATLITHADGTLSGILTSSPGSSRLAIELILLLVQNGLAAVCGLGLGALAGYVGAKGAPVPAYTAWRMPLPPGYRYPQGPYAPQAPYIPQGPAPWGPAAYPPGLPGQLGQVGRQPAPLGGPPSQDTRESLPDNPVPLS
jgi:hypothetical protein